jgi:hypothetical protein
MIWNCSHLGLLLKVFGCGLLLSIVTILRKLPARLATSHSGNIRVTKLQKVWWLALYLSIFLGYSFPPNAALQVLELFFIAGVWLNGCYHYSACAKLLRVTFTHVLQAQIAKRHMSGGETRQSSHQQKEQNAGRNAAHVKRVKKRIRQNMQSTFAGFNMVIIIAVTSNTVWSGRMAGEVCSRQQSNVEGVLAQIRLYTTVGAIVIVPMVALHSIFIFTANRRKRAMKERIFQSTKTKRRKSAVQKAPTKNAGSYDNNSDPRPNSNGSYNNKSKSGGSYDSKSKESYDNKSKESHDNRSNSGGSCESDSQSSRSQGPSKLESACCGSSPT